MTFKEKVYDFIVDKGIFALKTFFPEYFAKEPAGFTDRHIEYPFVLENLPKKQCKILDVGCSGSLLPVLMKSLGHDVYGIDIRDCKMGIKFYKKDITYTDFKGNYFDIITAVSTIEHIGLSGRYGVKNYEARKDYDAITEIGRILKPKGLFLMTVPYGDKFELTKFHKIYNLAALRALLMTWKVDKSEVQSPEADYRLALIKAIK